MKIKKCKKIDERSDTERWKENNYKKQIILERKVHLAIFALPKRKGLLFFLICVVRSRSSVGRA